MPLIKLEEASKNYLTTKFNLEINKGDLIIVSGTNGTGKSTLIKLLIGYIKPDIGVIKKHTKRITYLPENQIMPDFLDSETYLKELMRMKKGEYDKNLYYDFMIPNKIIKNLSKGNKQKLALVGCFIGKTDLYVFDEPLSGLDTKSINIFKKKILALKNAGASIVISTHSPKVFLKICDQHLCL